MTVLLSAAVVVALFATACSASDSASDSASNSASGIAEIEVGGRTLHLECSGTQSPTVVLQSGFGNAGDIWSLTDTAALAVRPGLATTNRVCVYDRPGSMITTTSASGKVVLADAPQRGRSDSAPMPRDPAEVVTELHGLLAAANVPGPYVLVGHSLGGTLNVLYARTYPEEVSALVIVDSPLPANRNLVSAKHWETLRVFRIDPTAVPGYPLESYDIGRLFDEIESAPPLPDIPVVLVRRGEVRMSDDPLPAGLDITQAELDSINEAQRKSQALFAASVNGAELITVPGTTHYVQNQRPDAVLDAVRAAITRT